MLKYATSLQKPIQSVGHQN